MFIITIFFVCFENVTQLIVTVGTKNITLTKCFIEINEGFFSKVRIFSLAFYSFISCNSHLSLRLPSDAGCSEIF